MALDQESIKNIQSWTQPADVGAFNQWLDALRILEPVAKEHGLTKIEAFSLYIQIQSLNKLAQIRDLLQAEADPPEEEL